MASFGRYKVHPVADAFPLMEGEEFDQLVADIDRQGLQEPIVLAPDNQTIVDGRNRWRACEKAGRDPVLRTLEPHYTEELLIAYIVSANLRRRHMTAGQKAALGREIKQAYAAIERRGRPPKGKSTVSGTFSGKAVDRAAADVGVGREAIRQAERVAETAPDLFEEVKQGTLEIGKAHKEAQKRERERKRQEKERAIQEEADQEDQAEDFQLVPPPHNGGRVRPEGTVLLPTHIKDETVPYPVPKSKATFNLSPSEGISWAEWSWNPVTGCLHGCPYCYARDIATNERNAAIYPAGFTPLFHHERLDAPANTRIPAEHRDEQVPCKADGCPWRRVFVCSMADLYGRWVPDDWIAQVHASMLASPQWQYILLTKFPARYTRVELPPNAWVGTSVDEQNRVRKAEDAFRKIDGVAVKWLSLEPLREPLVFEDLSMFDWVVIGAQTETHQPDGIEPAFTPPFDWVARLYVQAKEADCKVHIKPNILQSRPRMALPNEYPEVPA